MRRRCYRLLSTCNERGRVSTTLFRARDQGVTSLKCNYGTFALSLMRGTVEIDRNGIRTGIVTRVLSLNGDLLRLSAGPLRNIRTALTHVHRVEMKRRSNSSNREECELTIFAGKRLVSRRGGL